eukprot:9625353-Lingulodinium_polyedra.AAC.1
MCIRDRLLSSRWEPLLREAEKRPDDPILKEWIGNLVTKYGEDVKQWPKVGCEANFPPWKKGAPMVIEMQTKGGER